MNNIPKVRILNENHCLVYMGEAVIFYSYDKPICWKVNSAIVLDKDNYNYSRTTTKHLCKFLGIDSKTLHKRIKLGEYILAKLKING